jgi:hypothetical protein
MRCDLRKYFSNEIDARGTAGENAQRRFGAPVSTRLAWPEVRRPV